MKKTVLYACALLVLGLSACTKQDNTSETPKTTSSLNNLVSIVEIPAADLPRSIKFYSAILGVQIQEMEMGGVKMGILPNEEGTVNVVLANGSDYKPTSDGAVVYLNAGDDLQPILDKIEPNGGQVIVPKTEISPEMGFFALFIDPEGNKLGLHSRK